MKYVAVEKLEALADIYEATARHLSAEDLLKVIEKEGEEIDHGLAIVHMQPDKSPPGILTVSDSSSSPPVYAEQYNPENGNFEPGPVEIPPLTNPIQILDQPPARYKLAPGSVEPERGTGVVETCAGCDGTGSEVIEGKTQVCVFCKGTGMIEKENLTVASAEPAPEKISSVPTAGSKLGVKCWDVETPHIPTLLAALRAIVDAYESNYPNFEPALIKLIAELEGKK